MILKNKGISFKLNLFILLCSSIVFSLILFLNYEISRKTILRDIRENARNLTLSTANRIDRILLAAKNIAENLAVFLENVRYSSHDLDKIIKATVEENDEIFGCGIAFEPKSFIKDSIYYNVHYYKSLDRLIRQPHDNNSYFSSDWYDIPKYSQKPIWVEPNKQNIFETESVSYSVPIYKYDNDKKIFHGTVMVDISLDWIQKLCSSIKIMQSGYIFLLSTNGNFISHPLKENTISENIFDFAKKYADSQYIDIGSAMIKGDTGFVRYKGLQNKDNGWIYYAPMTSNNWSIGLFLPEIELYSDLRNVTILLTVIGVIGLIILFIIIFLISKKITQPLKDLALATNDIGTGKFGIELNETESNDEIGVLRKSFIKMEKALKEYINNLRITTTAKEKMENELNIAREIQMGIIPHVFPAFPNKKEFDLFAILEPAKTVGGDLYDYFLLDSNHLCFAIGDVSGKSIPAALYMSGTKTLLRAKANKKTPICKIVQGMNDILCEDSNASMFVTFFLGILDLLTGELEYFSAGHNPPYLSRYEKNIEILENIHSPALGILKQNLTLSSKIILEPHDEIILFTDGVTEAMNSTFELYSEKRLESELKNFKTNTPEETANNILKSVRNFAKDAEQFDDITILVIRYFGNNK